MPELSTTINEADMSTPVSSFELQNFIPCQFAASAQTVVRAIACVLEEKFGISLPEWKVLATVADSPNLCAVAVAKTAGMDTVAVSRAVTKLIDQGYISRELDRDDRRRSVLNLSERGAVLHQQIVPQAKELQDSLMANLSEEEMDVLGNAITTLQAKAREIEDMYIYCSTTGQPRQVPSSRRTQTTQDRRPYSLSPIDRLISSCIIPLQRT